MSRCNTIVLKLIAILITLIGLIAMLVAWELLLISNVHNTTVLALEMGGVVVCMIGYFFWRYLKRERNCSEIALSNDSGANMDSKKIT